MNLTEIIERKIYKGPIHNFDLNKKCIINTLNAHSYCIAKKDRNFAKALESSDVLLPDGVSIVLASRVLKKEKINKIAGDDIHKYLLNEANYGHKKIFYLGSSSKILKRIEMKIKTEFPNINVGSYSPPYKSNFSRHDSDKMISEVNQFEPDILFVGMTAPKQEKWVDLYKDCLNAKVIVSIGAVFDFYAENLKRAPTWIVKIGFEWLYRLIKEPKRMWRRYLVNNSVFLYYLIKEKVINIR